MFKDGVFRQAGALRRMAPTSNEFEVEARKERRVFVKDADANPFRLSSQRWDEEMVGRQSDDSRPRFDD